ncbi:hypothetical protein BaRGS_00022505 [Batillaria attramentaria]|uniref:Secreted protein n=1 Tax=Batillaria attramentaria TaxID=370345 RepID=A0ABD0KGL7_9CAEN
MAAIGRPLRAKRRAAGSCMSSVLSYCSSSLSTDTPSPPSWGPPARNTHTESAPLFRYLFLSHAEFSGRRLDQTQAERVSLSGHCKQTKLRCNCKSQNLPVPADFVSSLRLLYTT